MRARRRKDCVNKLLIYLAGSETFFGYKLFSPGKNNLLKMLFKKINFPAETISSLTV